MATVFPAQSAPGRLAAIQRRVQTRLVLDLARTARDKAASPATVAIIDARLRALAHSLRASPGGDPAARAHRAWLAHLLTDGKAMDAVLAEPDRIPAVPPGMPIGAAE